MNKKRLILLILIIGIVGYLLYFSIHNGEDGNSLRFSGNVEVTETRLSFRISGVMTERLVDEGKDVHAGETLARLDKTDHTIAKSRAEADLAYAESVLAELEAGSRPQEIERVQARVMQAQQALTELENGSRAGEIASVRAEYEKALAGAQSAEVQMNQAENDYKRYSQLFADGSVSKTLFEKYRTAFDSAKKRVEETKAQARATAERLALQEEGPRGEQIAKARAALKQAKAEFALVKAGPRKEAIDQAKARREAARAIVNQAKQQLSYTELTAPMDAVVLSTAAEPGEYLNPSSPVLTLGALNKPWLRAYIHEKDQGRISLNQEVTVTTDSFPNKKYKGRVSYISSQAEFTPKTVQTFEERVKLMYRIKVTLENPGNELKPGMPADGIIDLRTP